MNMTRQQKTQAEIRAIAASALTTITDLRTHVKGDAEGLLRKWTPMLGRKAFVPGADNLAHYVALRSHDLTGLQMTLSSLGLSSLGRSEARVLSSIDVVTARLAEVAGTSTSNRETLVDLNESKRTLHREQRAIFGADPRGPATRILVTLPTVAATDKAFVLNLIVSGADCFRINCAHDDSRVWMQMISNCRRAAKELKRRCPILMDLAGPKCRITAVSAAKKPRLRIGDELAVVKDLSDGHSGCSVAATISHSQFLDAVKPGDRVILDDGRAEFSVVEARPDCAVLRIVRAREKGQRIRVEKGLNFPDTIVHLSPLTEKDLRDLDFVAEHADIVGFSFVNEASDIRLLQSELRARRGRKSRQPIVLKIETARAAENLPELIVQGAGQHPLAVMIARGDLAVEVGFDHIAELQEQILWLCEAAHIPVIWATEVLAGLVKEGAPSRAEATDAAMAQRAECVMLNKGPYLVEAVTFLDRVLHRMDRHQLKKTAHMRPLTAWAVNRQVNASRRISSVSGRGDHRKAGVQP